MEAKIYTSEEYAIIERIARIVSSVRGVKTDYTHLAVELEQAIAFDIFGIVLLRHDREAVRVTICQKQSEKWLTHCHQRPFRDSMLERMSLERVLLVRNYENVLDGLPVESGDALSRFHHLRSTIIVPLMVEEHVLGTLELGSVSSHAYNGTALQQLVNSVASVVATAIEGVQLGGNAAIQDRQRKALQDVTSALTTKSDLVTILQSIVDGIAEALNVAACIILYDPIRHHLRLGAYARVDGEALQQVFQSGALATEKGILRETLFSHQPRLSVDIATDERFPESRILATKFGLHSIQSMPLLCDGIMQGVFFLGSSETGGFTPLKREILALFANQATVAIRNGQLLNTTEQRKRFCQDINDLEQSQRVPTITEDNFADVGDLALLVRVRDDAERLFGVSLAVLLGFVVEQIPLIDEKQLQRYMTMQHKEHANTNEYVNLQQCSGGGWDETYPLVISGEKQVIQESEPGDSISSQEGIHFLLERTTETALTQVALLGGLSRLLLKLQQSTDWVKDCWFIVDQQGYCIYMNPEAVRLCGVQVDNVHHNCLPTVHPAQMHVHIHQVFAKLLPRMRNTSRVCEYLQDLAQGNNYRQEICCDLAVEPLSGQESENFAGDKVVYGMHENMWHDTHYRLTSYPLHGQDQIKATALQMQDITEQVRDERNRSFLLSSVTHDLRTPLTTIKTTVTSLIASHFPWSEEDRREMLTDIDSETDHLTVLINDLMELSRIEMGALTLDKTWCEVVEVVDAAIEKLDQRMLAGRRIDVKVSPQSALIWSDQLQLQQLFFHLIKNAVSRSPELAPIEIVIEVSENREKQLCARIIDLGVNISDHERARIFCTFSNLRTYGNGMGLAICKGLVTVLQGEIWVETMEDGRISFSFTLSGCM